MHNKESNYRKYLKYCIKLLKFKVIEKNLLCETSKFFKQSYKNKIKIFKLIQIRYTKQNTNTLVS